MKMLIPLRGKRRGGSDAREPADNERPPLHFESPRARDARNSALHVCTLSRARIRSTGIYLYLYTDGMADEPYRARMRI